MPGSIPSIFNTISKTPWYNASIAMLLSYYLSNLINRRIFAFFAGLLLASTFPFVGFSFYAWIGLIPLLLLIKSSTSIFRLVEESLIFAITYNLIGFSWLLTLHPLDWQGFSIDSSLLLTLLAWLGPSLYHSLLVVIFAIFSKAIFDYCLKEQLIVATVLTAFAWTIIQHKLSFNAGPLSIFAVPINLLAYSQYQNTYLIQIVDIVGSIGLEFLIISTNLVLFHFIHLQKIFDSSAAKYQNTNSSTLNVKNPYQKSEIGIKHFSLFGVLLMVFFFSAIYSLQKISFARKAQQKQVSFAIAQANLSAKDIRGANLNAENVIEEHFNVTANSQAYRDMLIWPEGSAPSMQGSSIYSDLINKASNFATLFIFGTYYQDSQDQIFNSVEVKEYQDGIENQSKFYHKQNLVPFGEYTPFFKLLPTALQQIARSSVGMGFTPANHKQNPIQTKFGIPGVSICFELLFPNLIREQVLQGANFMLNLNDLSWFKSSLIKKEFLAVAVFRAIENNRDLLLVGNAGYSAHIDKTGKIIHKSRINHPDLIEGQLKSQSKLSIYSQYGW